MRVPLEGLVLIALALVLPAPPRRSCVIAGLVLGAGDRLKVLNYGCFTASTGRSTRLVTRAQLGIGIETLRSSVGRHETNVDRDRRAWSARRAGVLLTLAMLRLTRVAADNRRWALRAVAALGAVWVLCWVFGAQLISHTPIASTSAAGLVVTRSARCRPTSTTRVFAKQIRHDRFRNTPATGC